MENYTQREADILSTGLLDVLGDIGLPADRIEIVKRLYLRTRLDGVGIRTAYEFVSQTISDGTLTRVGKDEFTI